MNNRSRMGKGARAACGALAWVLAWTPAWSGAAAAQEAGAVDIPQGSATEPGVGFVEVLNLQPKDAPDACDPALTQVRLTVDGMLEGRGLMTAEVYADDQRGFLNKRGRVRRVRVPAQRPPVTVCMTVAPGTYAAVAYHDINGDRDLDKKWNKMPKEPFALSGERELKFGWPDIGPSLFDVPEGGADVRVVLVQP